MLQFIRSRILPLKPVQLLIQTGLKWQRDDCSSMAAALSYYALFSLFPILLVVLSIVGSLIGPGTDAFESIQEAVERFLPPNVHDIVKGTIVALNQSSTGAGVIGFGLLLYSASTVFGVLDNSVDKVWRVTSEASGARPIHRTVLFYIVNKLVSFLLVFGIVLLLFVSLLSNIVIKIVLKIIATFQSSIPFVRVDELQLAKGLQVGSSVLILAIVACILFKILPSTYVAWGDIWLAALITALLLVGLQQLVSNSVISIGSQYLSYGVIGSVMILMLWIYLTCQIFLLGCQFSYVYAHLFGSRRHLNSSSSL